MTAETTPTLDDLDQLPRREAARLLHEHYTINPEEMDDEERARADAAVKEMLSTPPA